MQEISKSVIPGESDQDWVAVHTTEDGTTWGVCGDGHGAARFPERQDFVERCKEIDWAAFFDSLDGHPGTALETAIDGWGINTVGTGACVCIFRLCEGVIDLWWRGDVMGVLYADGEQVFTRQSATTWRTATTLHQVTMGDLSCRTGKSVFSTPTTMTMVPDARINLNPHFNDRGSPFWGKHRG